MLRRVAQAPTSSVPHLYGELDKGYSSCTMADLGLLKAIRQHSSPGSEANQVVQRFSRLNPRQQQSILDFLRTL